MLLMGPKWFNSLPFTMIYNRFKTWVLLQIKKKNYKIYTYVYWYDESNNLPTILDWKEKTLWIIWLNFSRKSLIGNSESRAVCRVVYAQIQCGHRDGSCSVRSKRQTELRLRFFPLFSPFPFFLCFSFISIYFLFRLPTFLLKPRTPFYVLFLLP